MSLTCIVGSKNPVKVNATRNTLNRAFAPAEIDVTGISVPSGVADQPMTQAETRLGAINRVKACIEQHQADWYVAIEGGVDRFSDGPATFAYVALYNGQQWSVGRSANLPLPTCIYAALERGEELGDVMDREFGTTNVKQQGGAIGLLTHQLATRQSVYEVALLLALAPYHHEALYTRKL